MFRLKSILKEESSLELLEDVLHSEFRADLHRPLYRGSDHDINDGIWKIRSIRKNREPRDTDRSAHYLIDFFR